MALPKTALGAYLIAAGFGFLVVSFLPLPDDRAVMLLGLAGQLIPIIGISYMQKDSKRFGSLHAKRLNLALVVAVIALVLARFVLRGVVKRHDISPDAFAGLPLQAGVDVFVAGLAVLALFTLASSSERKLLVGGGAAVVVSSAITALLPTFANSGTEISGLALIALGILVVGYIALAVAGALYGKRFASGPGAPVDTPTAA